MKHTAIKSTPYIIDKLKIFAREANINIHFGDDTGYTCKYEYIIAMPEDNSLLSVSSPIDIAESYNVCNTLLEFKDACVKLFNLSYEIFLPAINPEYIDDIEAFKNLMKAMGYYDSKGGDFCNKWCLSFKGVENVMPNMYIHLMSITDFIKEAAINIGLNIDECLFTPSYLCKNEADKYSIIGTLKNLGYNIKINSSDDKYVVIDNSNAIFFQDENYHNYPLKAPLMIVRLNNFEDFIKQAAWLKNYNYPIFYREGSLKFLNIDVEPHMTFITESKKRYFTIKDNNNIKFIDKDNFNSVDFNIINKENVIQVLLYDNIIWGVNQIIAQVTIDDIKKKFNLNSNDKLIIHI